jgi:hypothetical protein
MLYVGLFHTLTVRAPRLLQDGGGDIDFDEFKTFWDTYNFEVAV